MKNKKNEVLQIRLTDQEKQLIKNKADILDITVTEYVKQCCLFSNITEMFISKLYGEK